MDYSFTRLPILEEPERRHARRSDFLSCDEKGTAFLPLLPGERRLGFADVGPTCRTPNKQWLRETLTKDHHHGLAEELDVPSPRGAAAASSNAARVTPPLHPPRLLHPRHAAGRRRVGGGGTPGVRASGRPFIVHGFNTYWLMYFAADPATRPTVTAALAEAADAGLNVCRTWAFNDGGHRALQLKPFSYDEEVFQALDFVISEARNNRMRLILSLCNNWKDYGGKAQYVRWGKEAGLDLTSEDDFFTNPTIKSYYKAFVKAVLTRINTITNEAYKDDPTIIAWELMNEPRCHSDPSGDTLQAWIEEMASYVKSIDHVHLLEIGVEGFYGSSTPELLHVNPDAYSGTVGTDFIRNHRALGIDLASVHIYSDNWLPHSVEDSHLQFVNTWMQQHIDDAANLLGMPILIGEFGVSIKDGRFGNEFREAFMETVYIIFLSSWQSGVIGGGCLVWQLFPESAEHMDDGYAVIFAKSPSTLNVLANHSRSLECAGSLSLI